MLAIMKFTNGAAVLAISFWLALPAGASLPGDAEGADLLAEVREAVWADIDKLPEEKRAQAEQLRRSWSEIERMLESGRSREFQQMLTYLGRENFLSPATIQKIQALAKVWVDLAEKRRTRFLLDGEALWKSASDKLLAAQKPEEIAAILAEIRRFQLQDYGIIGDDAEISELRQRIQQFQRFAVTWRGCLDTAGKGFSKQALEQFRRTHSQGQPPLFSLEQIKTLEGRLASKEELPPALSALREIKTLEQAISAIPSAAQEAKALESFSPNSNSNISQFLERLAKAVELQKRGFSEEAGSMAAGISHNQDAPEYPLFLSLQRSLAIWFYQVRQPLLQDLVFDPSRNPVEALEAAMVESGKALDLKRLQALISMAERLNRSGGYDWSKESRYVSDFLNAKASEDAGLHLQAYTTYQRLAASSSRFIDPSIVNTRMQALLSAQPELKNLPNPADLRAAVARALEEDPRFRMMIRSSGLPPILPPTPTTPPTAQPPAAAPKAEPPPATPKPAS